MQDFKGTILHFYESKFASLKSVWERLIEPIRNVKSAYELLMIGKFNQSVFEQIMSGNISGIEASFYDMLDKELKKMKTEFPVLASVLNPVETHTEAHEFKSLRDDKKTIQLTEERIAPDVLIKFRNAVNALQATKKLCEQTALMSNTFDSIDYSDCVVDNKGNPKVNYDRIKERLTVVIQTEKANEFFNLIQSHIDSYNALLSFVDQHKKTDAKLFIHHDSGQGLFLEDADRRITPDPAFFDDLDLTDSNR